MLSIGIDTCQDLPRAALTEPTSQHWLTQPMDPEKKSLNFIFPTKYVIPKSLKFSHWLSGLIGSAFLGATIEAPGFPDFFPEETN